MFQAYSKKKSAPINAKDVIDFSDTFLCPWCKIELTLKGVNSPTVSPYFAKKPSISHINCPCNFFKSFDTNIAGYEKCRIADIFNNSPLSIKSNTHSNSKNNTSNNNNAMIERISTPKRLLKYCLSHDINSEYDNGILISDICLDTRNILENNNHKGFTGIHLVIGSTYKYDSNDHSFTFTISNTKEKGKKLNAKVKVSNEQFKTICNYILTTFNNKFSLHPIAVLGEWTNTSDNNIECTVTRPANIIYKFTTE